MIFLHNPKTKKVIRTLVRITFFYAAFWLSTSNVFSQTYYFDEYGVQKGLPSKIFDLVQDDNGYVWLASESGISKFDGVNIKNYTSDEGLAEGGIKALLKDSNGKLWMGHVSGGLSFYDGKNMMVHPISEMIGFEITSLIMDKNNALWICTLGDGLIRLDNPNEISPDKVKYEQYKGGSLGDRVYSGNIALNDSLFFITDIGIKKYVESENLFKKHSPEGLSRYFYTSAMLEAKNGDIWFGTYNGGLYRFIKEKGEFKIFDVRDGLAHNWISTISEDSKGNIWVGTWGGGITKFSEEGFVTFNNSNGLSDLKIRRIKEDIEGNILIATNEHGLLIFKGEKFSTYGVDNGLSNQNVWSITQDKNGKFWFGTNNGISVYNPLAKGTGLEYVYFNQESHGIGDHIRFLKADSKNNIWIGTDDANVTMFNYKTGKFETSPVIGRFFRGAQNVTAMDIDRKNQLWIGTLDGLIYHEIDENKNQILTHGYGLNGNVISVVYADSKDRVWVGIDDAKGLNMINGEKVVNVNLEGSYTPNSIIEDSEGNIWVGTKAKGIIVLKDTTVQRIITEENGLISNVINQLNVDGNNIFIGTSRGLNKIDSEGNIHVYTEKSGFTGIEAKQNATFKDESGNLWFGTVNGVIKYQPGFDKEELKEPLTHISGLMINYEERDLEEGLKLNFTENTIKFDYNSISFENPDVILYQIMLDPAEKEWRPITSQTNAIYSSLAPEKYTFKVKARNSDGIWNKEPITYSFTIRPPFYKTWWFILTVVVAGILGIISYIKVRERALIKEKKILEEKVAERTAEVVQKSVELEKKNKDITDSIRYAKRIQTAVLPPEIPFDNTFVFFRPKDIVSGDFYWLEHIGDLEMIAAVDCTGHGVPGAFLSILGHSMLTKIVREYGILEPAKILDRLDQEIIHALHQKNVKGERVVNDGMDLALICYHRDTNILEFAGGYNPLIMIRKGELEEIKADRFPIGMTTIHHDKKFTNHEIKVEKGDSFYIFSDGYADQFGGEDGRKFRKKNMKELLLSIQDVPMKEQGPKLEEHILEWMKNHDQIDDMVFIGRRF